MKLEIENRFNTINTAIDLLYLKDDFGLTNLLCLNPWICNFRKDISDKSCHPFHGIVPDNYNIRALYNQTIPSSTSSILTDNSEECWLDVQPGETLLHIACRLANPRAVQLCVDFGIDVFL